MENATRPLGSEIPITDQYPQVNYSYHCDDSDGANFCDCQRNGSSIETCMFFGRRVEPIAFSLGDREVAKQGECPLFTTIPNEIRNSIFEYALTDCTSHPPDRDNKFRRFRPRAQSSIPISDIAFPLLQTCRAVYLEAYRLPLQLNPFTVYDFQRLNRPNWEKLAPWQFALIQRLDISLQQIALETSELAHYVDAWRAKARHQGAYVAPRFYEHRRRVLSDQVVPSFIFGLLKAPGRGCTSAQDGDESILPHRSHFYDESRSSSPIPATTRSMVARPLTHLTLRLTRTDWWTWGDSPDSTNVGQQLRLDPAFGSNDNRQVQHPSTTLMLQLAAQRRAGQQPQFGKNWGAIVEKLPDLKLLELVLETFECKKQQLETVVECAKTWRFPLDDTSYEMVWDGKVELADWSGDGTSFYDADEEEEARVAWLGDFDDDEEDETESDEDMEEYNEGSDDEEEENEEEENDNDRGVQSVNEEVVDWKGTDCAVRIVRYKRQSVL